jgi:hypothetical protein
MASGVDAFDPPVEWRRACGTTAVIVARARPYVLAIALDSARFGPARTLDLRAGRPSIADAMRRAEPWLRDRQMAKAGDVLVVTGRGAGSPGGVGAIRAAIRPLLARLKREGVIAAVAEHNPGALRVTLAPIRALFERGPRSRGPQPIPATPASPAGLAALDNETRRELRQLAEYSLGQLGVRMDDHFVADEMLRQFSILTRCIARDEPDRISRLKFLVSAARRAYEET